MPDLPIDRARGDKAVAVFNKLRLADVPGTPTMAEAGGDWFRDIVRALFGSLDPVTKQRMIRELLLLVAKKNAKALALDTQIATPSGFTTMGRVQVGDLVIDANGQPTRVVDKSPVFIGRDCFEVAFSSGEIVVCDAEHLWVTDAHCDRNRQRGDRRSPAPTAKTTAEIARTLKVKSGRYSLNNHRTALARAIELAAADLPIPPYVLGAWLGDGHSESAVITSGSQDVNHMVGAIAAAGHSVRIAGFDPRNGVARISIAEPGGRNERLAYRFRSAATRLGVLGNKHIPPLYLRASRAQRLELLRGLMDTDGTISKRGQAVFTTTLPALRDDVRELVASLGFKPCVTEWEAIDSKGKNCGKAWKVGFFPYDDVPVFALKRKSERQGRRPNRAARSESRQIVDVHRVASVPTQCIAVESETRQFLVTRSLIPTHNTTQGALLMLVALLLNERPRASCIMTAPVQDVAQLAFDAAAGAIALDPVLDRKLHVREHIKTIVHRETKAELAIMTFDPEVMTGQKPVYALIDELHVIAKMSKASSALRQLRGGMIPFPEGFLAFITTQSEEPPTGVFKAELDRARDIRDGKREGALLPVLYELPEDIQKSPDAWRDPAHWPMVTPNAGRSISIPRLVEEMRDAKLKGEDELRGWASQHLNIEIGIALRHNGWVGANYWEQCAEPTLTLDELLRRSEVVTFGIDGGGLDDLLGAAAIGREEGTGKWLHWAHAWAHEIVLERRKAEADRYQQFANEGDLTIVSHIGDDVEEVADIVDRIEQVGLLDNVGVDAAGIGDVVDALVLKKIDEKRIIGVPQGWKLVGTIKTVERKLAGKEMLHGSRPMMAWVVGNAKVEPRGNAVSITKQISGSAKIDPLMATFDAAALMSMNPKPRKRKYEVYFL